MFIKSNNYGYTYGYTFNTDVSKSPFYQLLKTRTRVQVPSTASIIIRKPFKNKGFRIFYLTNPSPLYRQAIYLSSIDHIKGR